MSENRQDAQHPASPTRLRQAQLEGDFPRSIELASSLQLLCGVTACYFLASSLSSQIQGFTETVWSVNLLKADSATDLHLLDQSISQFLWMLAPLLIFTLVICLLSHLVQNTSFSIFNRPVIDFSNLNPINNFQRLFTIQNGMRTALSLPKIVLILSVVCISVWLLQTKIGSLSFQSVASSIEQLVDCVFTVLIASTATMFLLAGFDYAIERFSFLRRNRMTDEQLREENRLQNVEPQINLKRHQFYQDLG